MKLIIIVVLVAVAGLATWRIIANRVDRTKPDAVAQAFLAQLKAKNIDKASKYWVPEGASAWSTSATDKLGSMQSGTYTRFFEDLPEANATLVVAPRTATTPANEQTLSSGNTSLGLRQIEGKWYVFKSPL